MLNDKEIAIEHAAIYAEIGEASETIIPFLASELWHNKVLLTSKEPSEQRDKERKLKDIVEEAARVRKDNIPQKLVYNQMQTVADQLLDITVARKSTNPNLLLVGRAQARINVRINTLEQQGLHEVADLLRVVPVVLQSLAHHLAPPPGNSSRERK